MPNFTYVGCSMTVGEGLKFEKQDGDLWVNLVSANFSAYTKNIAEKGNSNYNIFLSALNEILEYSPDKIFIQWSGLNRVWLYPGPDTVLKIFHTIGSDYAYRDINLPKKEIQKFANQYMMLNHDFNLILELINYCLILEQISKDKTQLIFINGLLPWTRDLYQDDTKVNFSTNLSNYSKEIFDFNNRNDEELTVLFTKINNEIIKLNKNLWINQFESMLSIAVDYGNDNEHPGIKSQHIYADMIINYLKGKNV